MRKWIRETGLNARAKDILEKYKTYINLPDDSMRDVLEYYFKNKLKMDTEELWQYSDENELYQKLMSDDSNIITPKEQLESTMDFAREILNLDALKLKTKVNMKQQTLILYREVGLTYTECKNIFNNFNVDMWSYRSGIGSFVDTFVDKYMRKNVNLFLATSSYPETLKIETSKLIKEDEFIYFTIDFKIHVDDLDEEILGQVGKIVNVMPKFA